MPISRDPSVRSGTSATTISPSAAASAEHRRLQAHLLQLARQGGLGAAGHRHGLLLLVDRPCGLARSLDDYGLPTITVPCGFSKTGLPIGLQISGPNLAEGNVLALAHAYQQATDWHTRKPPLQPDAKVPALSKTGEAQTGESVTR